MKKKGFTLIELLVVIAIIAMLLAILMPALSKVKKIAMRVVCGTNLKGLGTAQMVYANDYDDDFVVQGGGGEHTWGLFTAFWQTPDRNWIDDTGNITVGASLYLLVREADVSPKSFVCPASAQSEYDGSNGNALDLVELWDFGRESQFAGTGVANCVSYSYHMPYANSTGVFAASRFAADGTRSAAFAVMADKSPFFDPKLTLGNATSDTWQDFIGALAPYWDDSSLEKWKLQRANSQPHDRAGQNVVFADGHSSYEKTPDVGIKHDNIYTRWDTGKTLEAIYRQGDAFNDITVGDLNSTELSSSNDSLLVNDDTRGG